MRYGQMLNYSADEKTKIFAEYISDTGATVRGTAARFGVSKSTVHKYITERLLRLDPALHARVRDILQSNKAQRHIRGGDATRRKYQLLRESENTAGKDG